MEKSRDWGKALGIHLLPSKGHRQTFTSALFDGWLWDRKNEIGIALCLKQVGLSAAWMQQAGLLLAANSLALDDGLFIENNCIWMWRCLPMTLSDIEMAAALEVQMAVAQVLIDAH